MRRYRSLLTQHMPALLGGAEDNTRLDMNIERNQNDCQ